jgi:hypothetical protein
VGRFIVMFVGKYRSVCRDPEVVYFGPAQPSTSRSASGQTVFEVSMVHALTRWLLG